MTGATRLFYAPAIVLRLIEHWFHDDDHHLLTQNVKQRANITDKIHNTRDSGLGILTGIIIITSSSLCPNERNAVKRLRLSARFTVMLRLSSCFIWEVVYLSSLPAISLEASQSGQNRGPSDKEYREGVCACAQVENANQFFCAKRGYSHLLTCGYYIIISNFHLPADNDIQWIRQVMFLFRHPAELNKGLLETISMPRNIMDDVLET